MNSLTENCRQNLGPAPRKFPVWERNYYLPSAPEWLPGDALNQSVKDRGKLLKHGRVVLGALVQANMELFAPLRKDLPALAVWSEEPDWDADIPAMRAWGYRIFQLKGQEPEGDLERLTRTMNNERARPQNYPLPESFTGGKKIFLSSLVVFRRHLPYGYITSGILPLLVHPEGTPSCMVLPGRYWANELKDR